MAEKATAAEAQTLMILGDITDAKDRHSSALVNQVVDSIGALARRIPEVVLLAGNHDWLMRNEVFFRFLNHIPNVRFITNPTEDELDERRVVFLPYSKNPHADWKQLDLHTSPPDLIFMHQTFAGAIASNGEEMEGESMPPLPMSSRVYSGDIHVPQTLGIKDGPQVTYVGSPYHVHFGDDFKPRIMMLDRRCREQWYSDLKTPKRVSLKLASLRDLERLDVEAGDQIKLRFNLAPEDRHRWQAIKREALAAMHERGVLVEGIQLVAGSPAERIKGVRDQALRNLFPVDVIEEFARQEELPGDALEIGLNLLES